MGVLEVIGALAGGGGLGGIAGLAGAALQQYGKAKDNAHELEMARLKFDQTLALKKSDDEQELKRASLTAESQERIADMQAMSKADEARSGDLRASYDNDKATYSTPGAQEQSKYVRWLMGTVDAFRGFIRPGATVYALALNSLLILWARDMVQRSQVVLSQELAEKLFVEIVFSTTFLISTVVLWWFGSRPPSRK